jgi:uncharacterized protein YllA (UPF0747 family)
MVCSCIPDNARLKTLFADVVKKELTEQFSHKIVEETGKKINEHYKLQASGRDLNLFYLTENKRERLKKKAELFRVQSLGLSWQEEEIVAEVLKHPEGLVQTLFYVDCSRKPFCLTSLL